MLYSKTAVVTGTSSGIGEATARLSAQKRQNIVLAARHEDR
jgi:NADP-dependent 3-hydroxy acid dehydrogenase YdfG